jgi:predicted transcriptional regulator
MALISSKLAADRKSRFFSVLELLPMSHASRSAHIADLIDDLVDLYLAQVADLREFAQATEAGEGATHLEDALRHREIRRADLYRQFELAAFSPAPIPVVAPNGLDLPGDN